VLQGVPAADFSSDELLYLPRNVRSHRLYGMSPVEQIALTVNIALRRDAATPDYYRSGSIPDSFATLPKEWTTDQIRQFHSSRTISTR
jgi:phage portal protein BeeE